MVMSFEDKITLLFFCLLFAGCKTNRHLANAVTYNCIDSVYFEKRDTIYQPVTVVTPPDSSLYRAFIECINGMPTIVKETTTNGPKTNLSADYSHINDATLEMRVKGLFKGDSQKVVIPGSSSTIKSQKSSTESIITVCPECKVSPWNMFLIKSAYAFYGLILLWIAWRVIRIYLKTQTGI
jgi:hypothetical protein